MHTEPDPQFEALLAFLRDSRGFDFTGYKRPSLTRRVQRRLQQLSLSSYGDYRHHLEVHPEEFTALFDTILINVTGFFRDPDAWTHLHDVVLPAVLAERGRSDPVRAWSAGCASGAEAYTLAIVLAELLGRDEYRRRVTIYATDVDEDALTQARRGVYSQREVRDVPADLREKYFHPQGEDFVFRSDLRRSVIFGRNDLVGDSPISRVDLLACRNTLMYFDAETQAKIVSRLHFALNDGGVLFLGKAEMLLSHGDLFAPIDLSRRFFRKQPVVEAPTGGSAVGTVAGEAALEPLAGEDATRIRSEALAATPVATLVVAADGNVAFANQRAQTLFGLAPREVGRPFHDLDMSSRPIELRGYLDQVRADRRSLWVRDVEWAVPGGESVYLDIEVSPLVDVDGGDLGVALYFADATRFHRLQTSLEATNRQLETAYEELQSTVEELETTNEELETTNEELQATNEELETMNEELQSSNDELQAINDELRERTQDLDDANAFTESVLASPQSVVVVLDGEMSVRAWNRGAADTWGLREEEVIGRQLPGLDIGLPTDRLTSLVRAVLRGAGSEEVRLDAVDRKGRAVTLRVRCRPLRRPGEEPTGVIVLMDLEPAAPGE